MAAGVSDGQEIRLSPGEIRTFRLHLAHSVLEALAAGIITNAGLIAIKTLDAEDWQLTVPLAVSSIGMFVSWGTAQIMARRNKRAFIVVPFLLQAICVMGMATVPGAGWFLFLAGMAAVFEITVRPAMASFFRTNYRPDFRGRASGIIRGWCALAFLFSNLSSAVWMQFGEGGRASISILMVVAALILIAGLACISAIRMQEDGGRRERPGVTEGTKISSLTILKTDRRFTTYLLGSTGFIFGGLLYVSLIPAVLSKDFGYGYVASALLLHVIPSLVSFGATQGFGRRLDHVNPLKLWSVIRAGWGLDPILLGLAAITAPASSVGLVIAVFARSCRGACMGTAWVLWWMVGVNYFAPPGADTSRYMGIQTLLNGIARLATAGAAALLLQSVDRIGVLFIGGFLIMLSALHARWQASHDPEGAGSLIAQERKFQGE